MHGLPRLAGDPAVWRWGWGVFMLCTLVLVAFMAVLERLLPDRSTAGRLALVLTASGMAVDLLCDVLQISVLPFAPYLPTAFTPCSFREYEVHWLLELSAVNFPTVPPTYGERNSMKMLSNRSVPVVLR